MRKHFNQYLTLSNTECESIWEESIFILDTNVLLNLHRYNETTSSDLLQVLERISDQLWIPYQVALEYHENLETVTIGQINQYEKVKSILRETTEKLNSELDKLDLDKRHSRINTGNFIGKIEDAITDFQLDLDELKKQQPIHHQRLHQNLQNLLEGKIGPAPNSQKELDELYKKIEERYKLNRPPGFKDVGKAKEIQKNGIFFHDDICYQRCYGDAIVWFQIIEEAIKRKAKSVIFVTDDFKEDWWRILGGQKRGPRYELIDEIQSKAKVEHFHLYSSYSFLEFAKQKYQIEVDENSIQQIIEVTQMAPRGQNFPRADSLVEQNVINWIIQTNPESQIKNSDTQPFDVFAQNGSIKTAYATKFITRVSSVMRYLNDLVYQGYFGISEGKFDKAIIVFVYDEENSQVHWSELKRLTSNFFSKEENVALSESIFVIIGCIREEIDAEGNLSNHFVPYLDNPSNSKT